MSFRPRLLRPIAAILKAHQTRIRFTQGQGYHDRYSRTAARLQSRIEPDRLHRKNGRRTKSVHEAASLLECHTSIEYLPQRIRGNISLVFDGHPIAATFGQSRSCDTKRHLTLHLRSAMAKSP